MDLQPLTVHLARPVIVPWTCHRTGDCCRIPHDVTVSAEERSLLIAHAPPDVSLTFTARRDGFHTLHTGPCPLLKGNDCSVYDVRPYNCRRFMCGRVEVEKEPFDASGPLGCANLSDRIADSKPFASFARRAQRQAQIWAVAHGWSPTT